MPNFQELNRLLASAIDSSVVGPEITNALLPGGVALDVEGQYYDYKESLPYVPPAASDAEKAIYKAEISDLIKDAASFYNACGGYILFGVRDSGSSRLPGCAQSLDCGDFNKRIEGALGVSVECIFGLVAVPAATAGFVGVLLIPRRPDHCEPVSFRKSAVLHPNGKRAFSSNDTYVRIRDESRPASASSADWRFLHGPRKIDAAPAAGRPSAKPPIRVSLPARDPDLTKFIGREEYLARLRHWLADKRSPVRLLTGIGGLGKTSIAYRFAEEIADTQAGEIEQLVWLTAKARTFSALGGGMVEASRVDFSDSLSLYNMVLSSLGYAPDWGEDEPSASDVVERIVEALSIYACLIIIDDVDSLAPSDQREVVHTLSGAVARTVTGSRAPSRILFTSRIDQGVAPGSVIKVEGFPLEEFRDYVAEVSNTLSIKIDVKSEEASFYAATSGSPLFVASILRLVRLGTPFAEAIAKWKGEEGVEVRRFAFQRELQRLPPAAARLLYAACMLGDTTTLELAHVLEISERAVQNSIADLQSFHLILTQTSSRLGNTIAAPDDVSLTRDVLHAHLGLGAEVVEAACARARTRTQTSERGIAHGIANVVALWKADAHREALIATEELSKAHPSNGDVSCLVATALTKGPAPRWAEADAQFLLASKQGCSRPELIEGWIAAKRAIQDWTGLLNLARKTAPTGSLNYPVMQALILATEELLKIARVRGDRARRIELASSAIEMISRRMERQRLSHVESDIIWDKKLRLARGLMDDHTASCTSSGDKIRIFDALWWLVNEGVFLREFVVRGISGLEEWWSDVERRPYVDEIARRILLKSLNRLDQIEGVVRRDGKNLLADQVQQKRLELAHRAAKLA